MRLSFQCNWADSHGFQAEIQAESDLDGHSVTISLVTKPSKRHLLRLIAAFFVSWAHLSHEIAHRIDLLARPPCHVAPGNDRS
jgi:hypothetical protein